MSNSFDDLKVGELVEIRFLTTGMIIKGRISMRLKNAKEVAFLCRNQEDGQEIRIAKKECKLIIDAGNKRKTLFMC